MNIFYLIKKNVTFIAHKISEPRWESMILNVVEFSAQSEKAK